MTAHIERTVASLADFCAPPRRIRFVETAKKTGIASSLVGLGAALHLVWHALPFLEAATAGGLVLVCHS